MPKYDPDIWFQVSGKYRMVARLPSGMSGVQALKTLHIREPQWAEAMGEGHAGDHYLRMTSHSAAKTLTTAEWKKFKEDGGTTYLSRSYQKHRDRVKNLVQQMVRDNLVYPDKVEEMQRVLMRETRTQY